MVNKIDFTSYRPITDSLAQLGQRQNRISISLLKIYPGRIFINRHSVLN